MSKKRKPSYREFMLLTNGGQRMLKAHLKKLMKTK